MTGLRPLDRRGTAITLLLCALWGTNPVAAKIGLAYVPPLRLAYMRLALGGLAVLVYAWSTGRRGVFTVRRGEWRTLWSVGASYDEHKMNMYLLQRYRPSALAAWSLTTPIFGVLVSAVIAGDALGPTVVLSTLMVAAGIGLTTRR